MKFRHLFAIFMICFIASMQADLSTSFQWKQLQPSGSPPARRFAALAFDPSIGQLLLFGGFNGRYLNDLWAFDAKENKWVKIAASFPVPSPRAGAAMAFDPSIGKMIVFGGNQGDALQDLWAYDAKANKWTNLKPSLDQYPSGRGFASMAYDPINHQMIVFGGERGSGLKETWSYDAQTNRWTNLTPHPFPAEYPHARYGSAMVFDLFTKKMILFGGGYEDLSYDDTWAFDGQSKSWKKLNPIDFPSAREWSAATIDRTKGILMLFGGSDGDSPIGGTWKYDVNANTWEMVSTTSSPSNRYGAVMGYDPLMNQMILFGGKNEEYLGDTWSLTDENGQKRTKTD